ncbi:hypothetical protein CJF42_18195 [Pseudoalteromonas sp. NBT06-2]|uniref:tRNA1(Val) (adenine(37)-N6)-methyltransferase n=1 Tax=Pseudoalteromonas sp. NBT06-2 TaxID=2025950 RepID=UPI000BA53B18|nr:methyltransferase [Pseudoalteromonas sp. NBT06-2]PAJ72989.1 hypothetical protein CJF42_18195 [Pseudoalteromonas sp. NBT06-2]
MSSFQFKQFYLAQNNCAMKVGTDGVLLGAWADIDQCKNMLDVGTGTGLIALMLKQRAQKYNMVDANIFALEIDESAFLQATENFHISPWQNIKVYHNDFNQFKPRLKFDLVVSNPPYFINSLKGSNDARNTARHTCSLSFKTLIQKFCNITHDKGRLALVLPFDALKEIELLVNEFDLCISKLVYIFTKKNKPAKRILIELHKINTQCERSELFIHDNGEYSQDFINLTKDFYLKM